MLDLDRIDPPSGNATPQPHPHNHPHEEGHVGRENQTGHKGRDAAPLDRPHNHGDHDAPTSATGNAATVPATSGLHSGFLTVLEEIPGFVHWADMTAHLAREGYWARWAALSLHLL